MTIGRNEPCPCGSGKKYKKCCMAHGIDPARYTKQKLGLFHERIIGELARHGQRCLALRRTMRRRLNFSSGPKRKKQLISATRKPCFTHGCSLSGWLHRPLEKAAFQSRETRLSFIRICNAGGKNWMRLSGNTWRTLPGLLSAFSKLPRPRPAKALT